MLIAFKLLMVKFMLSVIPNSPGEIRDAFALKKKLKRK